MIPTLEDIRSALEVCQNPLRAEHSQRYFKTAPGEYGEHEEFLGISMPDIRKIAKGCDKATYTTLAQLISSKIHEERMLAVVILVNRYKRQKGVDHQAIIDFYIEHLDHINNWDLVDISAPYILGPYFFEEKSELFNQLLTSANLWYRRMAILSTFYAIRQKVYTPTIKAATLLYNDPEDLIHKALGWMLREVGKRNENVLREFLDQHAKKLPRTMLRYAIEKLPNPLRQHYMTK